MKDGAEFKEAETQSKLFWLKKKNYYVSPGDILEEERDRVQPGAHLGNETPVGLSALPAQMWAPGSHIFCFCLSLPSSHRRGHPNPKQANRLTPWEFRTN